MNLRLTLPSGVRWSPVLVAGLACAALAAATVVTYAVPILVSAFMPGSRADEVDTIKPLLARHDEQRSTNEARFEGRSLFFPPSDWKRKIPPPPPPP
ncbi:MAG: hypothetical protein ACKOQW_08360, partial [Phycisphaerales bacterium]